MGKGTMTRRKVLGIGGFGVLGLVLDWSLPLKAFSWGSVWATNSHQFILEQAYAALSRDPAFPGTVFPPLSEIVQWEGQDSLGGSGNGPDRSGMSSYSQHYYNPRLARDGILLGIPVPLDSGLAPNYETMGKGPASAALHAGNIFQGVAVEELAPKDLAWAAHFLADMWVPYHVNGCSKADLDKLIRADFAGMTLPDEVLGDWGLCYLCPLLSPDAILRSIKAYRDAAASDPNLDWFDPWYWNGNGSKPDYTSSHTLWEGEVYTGHQEHSPVPHYHWQNPEATFEEPWKAHAAKVEAFAKACAGTTVDNIEGYYDDPQLALIEAIDSVYTLWRAGFSALKPTLSGRLVESSVPGLPSEWLVDLSVENLSQSPAEDIRAKLTVQGGDSRPVVQEELLIPLLPARDKAAKTGLWKWPCNDPNVKWQLTVEVIGTFRAEPDAQYALAKAEMGASADWPRTYRGWLQAGVVLFFGQGMGGGDSHLYVSISLREIEDGSGLVMATIQDYTGVTIAGLEASTFKAEDAQTVWNVYGEHDGNRYTIKDQGVDLQGGILADRLEIFGSLGTSRAVGGEVVTVTHSIMAPMVGEGPSLPLER